MTDEGNSFNVTAEVKEKFTCRYCKVRGSSLKETEIRDHSLITQGSRGRGVEVTSVSWLGQLTVLLLYSHLPLGLPIGPYPVGLNLTKN